jgi:hypothetical protein
MGDKTMNNLTLPEKIILSVVVLVANFLIGLLIGIGLGYNDGYKAGFDKALPLTYATMQKTK